MDASADGASRATFLLGRLILFGVVAWSLSAAVVVALALLDARSAQKSALAAREQLDVDAVTSGRAAAELSRARSRFQTAAHSLDGAVVAPVRLVPVLGRQVRAVADLAGAGARIADAGVEALEEARDALSPTPRTGPDRLAAVSELRLVTDRAADRLRRIRLVPPGSLAPPVADRWNALANALEEATDGLTRGAHTLEAVHDLLAGPRRYLLLGANNAEMRAGSGMFLSIGLLETRGGGLALGEFEPAGLIQVDPRVPVDGDLAERWGWTDIGRDWRDLGLSPRFDRTAELAARMWEARGGGPVDGALAVDAVALAALLEATGPVEVPGLGAVDGAGAQRFVLRDQYRTFPPGPSGQHDDRRDALGALAKAAFDRLEAGEVDAAVFGRALGAAASGRHVLAWSRHAPEQRGWEAARLSGRLTERSLMVNVLNRGGNKLDQFLDVVVEADRQAGSGPVRLERLVLRVALANDAPSGEPQYVVGPGEGLAVAPGTYVGLLSVSLPAGARNSRFEGCEMVTNGADGPTRVAVCQVEIPAGGRSSVRLVADLPPGDLQVEPSARVPAVQWGFVGRRWSDDRRVTVPASS